MTLPQNPATPRRWRAPAGLILVLSVATFLNLLVVGINAHHIYGSLAAPKLSPDFGAFWAAAKLTIEGKPALAYDWQAHRAVEVAGIGGDFVGALIWQYPPPVQMLLAPLGALPLFAAMVVWLGISLGLFLRICWRILPGPVSLLAGLAAAPTAIVLTNGQTGLLFAALLGFALLELDRRPVRAGLCLALLGLKPHLIAAVPVVLAFARRWKVLAVAVAGFAGLVAASLVLLGSGTWAGFFRSIALSGRLLEASGARFELFANVYGGLRDLGAAFWPAMAGQAAVSLVVLGLVIRAWRSRAAPDLKAALLCYAAVAVVPRVFNYDADILVIGALFQCRHALAHGFFPGEKSVLGLAAAAAFASIVDLPGAYPFLAPALFAALWVARLRGAGRPEAPA